MKVEIEWPPSRWCDQKKAVRVSMGPNSGPWYYKGEWDTDLFFPAPTKRRTEELWQQHRKLESLTDEELVGPWLGEYGHPCSTQEVKDFARAVVTADRKREAQIRERLADSEKAKPSTINGWIGLYNKLRDYALECAHPNSARALRERFPEAHEVPEFGPLDATPGGAQ